MSKFEERDFLCFKVGLQQSHNVNLPKVHYLELQECERLINICEPDFRQLVRAALLTGCRYGELVRLVSNDFNAKQGTIHLRETKNGKSRFVPLTQEGITFFKQATIGKLGNALIFTHNDGSPWGTSHQSRRLKDACAVAKIVPAISFHVLRHTYGSILASKGVPLQVIAELLGHSDTRITSQHYAYLMPSFVSDTLRANLPRFAKDEKMSIKKFAVG
jgi:integrase